MTRFLAILGTVVLLLGLGVGWLLEPGHVPLLDANRIRLAESYLEGWASGQVWAMTNGMGSAELAAEIRDDPANEAIVNDFDPGTVITAFCVGLDKGGFSIRHQECMDIMQDRQYWPTYDGEITASWNRRYPWPGGQLVTVHDDSRTGDRDNPGRIGITR